MGIDLMLVAMRCTLLAVVLACASCGLQSPHGTAVMPPTCSSDGAGEGGGDNGGGGGGMGM